ncbi:MAG: metallophosphoesterase family protein [Caldisericaceae bacterium]
MFVVSDIHCPDRISAVPDIGEYILSSDVVFALGDFTRASVLEHIRGFGRQVYAVNGNMDEAKLKLELPSKRIVEIEGFKIGLTHGVGAPLGIDKRVASSFDRKLDAYVFGHSHISVNRTIEGSLYFNPGALSAREPSFGFLYVEQKNIWGEIVLLKKGDEK